MTNPIPIKNCNITAIVTRDRVYLQMEDSEGRTLTFEPPTSAVTQRWAKDMTERARFGAQLEMKL